VLNVKALVASGADPNQVNDYGWTALMFAVRSSNPATVEYVIQIDGNVDAADNVSDMILMARPYTPCEHLSGVGT
jgi:ankyrin repeat protein